MNRVNVNIRWVYAWLAAVILSSCALQPQFRPVTDPTMRFRGTVFSALPPQGKDWYIERHDIYRVRFNKFVPEKTKQYHNLIAGVLAVKKPEVLNVHSPAEFPKAVEEFFRTFVYEARDSLISVKAAPFGSLQSYCSQYDTVLEERGNPSASGVTVVVTSHGFICLDASSTFMINAYYHEKRLQGSEPLLDDSLRQEVEGFLKDVLLTPIQ